MESAACELGIAVVSLSSLLCVVFLAVDILNRGGFIGRACLLRLRVLDVLVLLQ